MKHFIKFLSLASTLVFLFLNDLGAAHGQNTPTLVLSPQTMTFDFVGTAQSLAITASDNSSIAPAITVSDPEACPGVGVSVAFGQGPLVVTQVVNFSFAFGTLTCHIRVTDPRLGTAELPVTLINGEVTGPHREFVIGTASISLASTNSLAESWQIWMLDQGTTPIDYKAEVTAGGEWLRVSPTSGTVPAQPFTTAYLQVQAVAGSLAPGIYSGAIKITPTNLTNAPPLVVPVSFTVAGHTPIIVNGTSNGFINFQHQYKSGLPAPPPQALSIMSGGAPLSFSATLGPAAPWLKVEPLGERLSTPATFSVQLTPQALTLPVGGYYATILVSAPQASIPGLAINVMLTVTADSVLAFANNGPMTFNYQIGGALPPAQEVTVTASGTPQPFDVQVLTSLPKATWSVTPAAGTASGTSPQNLVVRVDPLGLDPGTYMAQLQLSTQDNSIPLELALNVATSVQLNGGPSILNFSFHSPQEAPRPQTVNISSTKPSVPFTIMVAGYCGGTEQRRWFTVSPSHGVTNGTVNTPISVTVDPKAVSSQENCSGHITVESPDAANTIQIPALLHAITFPPASQ